MDLMGGSANNREKNRYYGFYRARVTEVDLNEEFMKNDYGAIRVFIPDLMTEIQPDGEYREFWQGLIAYPANNVIGGRNPDNNNDPRNAWDKDQYYHGQVFVPRLSDWVWIFFEGGNINRPFYWNAVQTQGCMLPPENRIQQDGSEQDEPHRSYTIYKTWDGRAIIMSDSEDVQRIEITGRKRKLYGEGPEGESADTTYEIDDNQTSILFDERQNREKILIRSRKGDFFHFDIDTRQLHIFFQGRINIASQESIFLAANDDINLIAGRDINLRSSCGNINMKAISQNINMNSYLNINMRTKEEDINLYTETRDINIVAERDYNREIFGKENVYNHDLVQRKIDNDCLIEIANDLQINVQNDYNTYIAGDYKLLSDNYISVMSTNDMVFVSERNISINSVLDVRICGDIDVSIVSGSDIYVNGGADVYINAPIVAIEGDLASMRADLIALDADEVEIQGGSSVSAPPGKNCIEPQEVEYPVIEIEVLKAPETPKAPDSTYYGGRND